LRQVGDKNENSSGIDGVGRDQAVASDELRRAIDGGRARKVIMFLFI
jgi:hypothetical protein